MESKNRSRRPNLVEAAMKYKEITLTLTALLVAAGIWALATMPRMEDPNITIRQGIVVALYPGATETQIESQLTQALEGYLFSFREVRKEKTYSTSRYGQVVINVQLQDWVKDKDRFWATLQHGLNGFRAQSLPPGVLGPVVYGDFGETVALMLTLSAPSRTYAEIDRYLDHLEDKIKTLPQTSRIRRYGGQQQQWLLSLDNTRMQGYGFDALQLIRVLQARNGVSYAGELTGRGDVVPVFGANQYAGASELMNQLVYTDPQGHTVRLRDVATLKRTYQDEKSFIKVGNQRAMMLSVEMQPGHNIVAFGHALEQRIEAAKATLPPNVVVNVVSSQPMVVADKLNEFMKEFIIAIVSVIGVVLLLLPFRMALISAVASPVSVLITFSVLQLLGYEIHQVTLAALIICLGMVVDDAIVVVDNYVEKLDHGLSRWDAAWQSATQLFVPILAATATIIFAFLPLMFTLHGLPNEFVAHLPPTIAIALACSFLVAVLLTPYLCFLFVRRGLHDEQSAAATGGSSVIDRIQRGFDKAVEIAFRYWKTALALALSSVVLAGVIGSKIPPEFLPIAERNQFNVEVHLRNGSSVKETEKAVDRLVAVLQKDPRAKDIISFVGTSSPRFYATYAPEPPRENYAQIFINTVSSHATVEMVQEYLDKLEDLVPNGQVRLRQLSFQEELAPIEVRVVGDSLEALKAVGEQVRHILEQTEGTNFIRTDFGEDYFATRLAVREDAANRLGLNRSTINQTLGAGLNGLPVTTLWEGKTPVEVVLRLRPEDRGSLTELPNIYLSVASGQKVPLFQVAELRPAWQTGSIVRRNGLRTLTVRSEAQRGQVAAWVLEAARPQLNSLNLPAGVRLEYGGDDEATRENLPDLAKGLFISLLLIFITLLLQFQSLRKALIILVSFPLSLFGAMLGLYLSGNHAGFTTFLGITSLIGIVVRNGIILVDYADELVRDHGFSIRQAAIASAQRRMRPIFLTSSAAAVGVLPMIFGGSPLWSPMGSILAVGLMVSMFMTLFAVPILYSKLIRPLAQKMPQIPEPAVV